MAFLDLTPTSIACTLFVVIITLVLWRFKHRNMSENSPSFPSILPWRSSLPSSSLVSDHHQSDSHQNTPSSSSVVPFDISYAPQIKYDVFISFRGSDTRRGFLGHLYKTLQIQKGVETYVDYKLREGNELSSQLLTAIEQSQIALVILSEDYASSRWCLVELAKIIECMKYGQIVIPIFYNIDPSDVRHQKGCYENAFTKHEKRFKDNPMMVKKWRSALKRVADLSGFHSTKYGTEVELIEVVVQRVLNRLNAMHQFDLHGLVGISYPIAYLKSLIFCNGSKDVRVIGIWGMGGIGKTTLARALFHILCSEYESCYFLANVREQIEKSGILQLQNDLLCKLLEEKDLNTGVPAPAHVWRRLGRKRILVVFDDVGNPDQVRELVGGGLHCLGPGSRIIVTTRNKHVLCKDADDIYEVKALEFKESLQLLTLHAFNGKGIQMGYDDLMVKVAEYAKGVPLALKVLGSFLYGKSTEEWRNQLDKLQKMPFEGIQKVLRLSYDGLDREEKKTLLYIVCFFGCSSFEISGEVITLLDACGYSTTIALRTLEDRTLITRNYRGAYVVHDLIRQMTQEIVLEQNIEKPGERHHLWDPHDIRRVLENQEGTDSIETISLDISRIDNLSLSSYSFARMVNLKLLKIHTSGSHKNRFCNKSVQISDGYLILPANLRLFSWVYYPLKSLPPELKLENLVELSMVESRVEKLWDGTQNLPNLKEVSLGGSKQLREIPDLSKALSLESLHLWACKNLVSVHPSVFFLPKLVGVYLNGCERLEGVLSEEASASASSSSSNLKKLDFSGCTRLKRLPDSFSKLTSLEELCLEGCKELDTSNLHILFDGLSSLKKLCLDKCDKLYEAPHNISNLSLLEKLSLEESNVKSMPESIKYLPRLKNLSLKNCKRLESLPEIPPSLRYLDANNCESLERVFTPTDLLYQQHIKSYESYLENSDSYCAYIDDTYFLFRNCPKLEENAITRISEYYSNWCTKSRREAYAERRIRKMSKDIKDKMATRSLPCWKCCNKALWTENDSSRMSLTSSLFSSDSSFCSCLPLHYRTGSYSRLINHNFHKSTSGFSFRDPRRLLKKSTNGTSCGDPPWLRQYLQLKVHGKRPDFFVREPKMY